MKIIKATIKERYIFSDKGIIRQGLHEINHDIRYFSSREKFHEWYETFKDKLWEDDPSKVDLAEGIYVETEELDLDNTAPPRRLQTFATFREGTSYYYAN